ncbi:MAG: hypothetical protein GX190_00345 [Mollicutes bacterium]|nr:hypothetical protein [Mollicutes bacterium]
MNLSIIISNDDNRAKEIWEVLEICDFFDDKLVKNPVVISEKFYQTIPKINPQKRYVVVSKNLESKNKNIIVFKDNEQLLRRLKMLSEDFFIISDKEMFEYFLPYAKKVYFVEIKNIVNKTDFDLSNFEQKKVAENKNYKIKIYRKER